MNEACARAIICLRLALGEIVQHKGRAALSVIGVVLGIVAMSSMVALSAGIVDMTNRYMSGLSGPQAFEISTHVPDREAGERDRPVRGVSREDADLIRAQCPAVGGAVATMLSFRPDVRRNGTRFEHWCVALGTDERYAAVAGASAHLGRNLVAADITDARRHAVITPRLYTNLFTAAEDPIGQKLELAGAHFEVVGVITNTDATTEWYVQRAILVPITAMPAALAGNSQLRISAWAASPELLPAATQQVWNVLYAAHGTADFEIATHEEMVRQLGRFQRLFTFVFGGVAAIALVVAAVNIMSVTLVSLNRRVREIGVHKAIGAGAADLFTQFIAESLILSLTGGLLGLLLSTLSIRLMGELIGRTGMTLQLRVSAASTLIGLAFCVGIGFLAGLYPAIRAARMDPVEALRRDL